MYGDTILEPITSNAITAAPLTNTMSSNRYLSIREMIFMSSQQDSNLRPTA